MSSRLSDFPIWILLVLLAAGCAPVVGPAVPPAPTTSPNVNAMHNIIWEWTEVSDKTTGGTTIVPAPELYTLILRADGTLIGGTNCTTFSGTYTQENGFDISLGSPSTLASCGEDSLDQLYLELLGEIVAGGPDGSGGMALETPGAEKRMSFRDGGPAPW